MLAGLNEAGHYLDNLKQCRIKFSDDPELSHANSLTAFEVAPRLRNASINLLWIAESHTFMDLVKLPWAQLTELKVQVERMDIVVVLFALCSKLTTLTLDNAREEVLAGNLPSNIQEYPHLRCLVLYDSFLIPPAAFPGLQKLRIVNASSGSIVAKLHGFLLPSRLNINSLSLRFDSLSVSETQDLIDLRSKGVPNLTTLKLCFETHHSDVYESLFRALSKALCVDSETKDDKIAMPRLKELKVDGDNLPLYEGEFEQKTIHNLDSEFVDMLESRWNYYLLHPGETVPFKLTVHLTAFAIQLNFPGLPEAQLRRLQALKDAGMPLFIFWQKAIGRGMFFRVGCVVVSHCAPYPENRIYLVQ
jgi:hypothetical protein